MLSWMTAAIVAIVGVAFAPALPTATIIVTSLIVGFCVSTRLRSRWRWPVVAFLLAASFASSYGLWRSAQLLPVDLEGKDLTLRFRVLTPPERRGGAPGYYRFDAKPEGKSLGRLRLNWYGERPPNLGDVISAQVRLRRPHGYRSPGAFDYGRWLFISGYSGVGYVRRPSEAVNQGASPNFSAVIFRQRLIAGPVAYFDRYVHGAVMKALLFADRSGLRDEQWALFSQTGTSHLMAISGMHIGMVLLWGWGLGRVTGFIFQRSLPLKPVIAMSFALIYAAMAGFSVPTQRALVMAAMAMLAFSLRRQVTSWQVYFTAMLVVLIIDPLAPHKVGFNLSFAAVAVLLWAFQGQRQQRGLSLLRSQWVVVIGLLPLLGMWGLGFSLVSLPANLVAIPLVGMLVLPALFIGLLLLFVSPKLAELPLSMADSLLGYLELALRLIAKWQPVIHFYPPPAAVALGIAAIFIALLPRGVPAKWLAMLPLVAMFYWPVTRPVKGDWWVTVLDVGQGLAVVIQTHSKALLYDVGPDFSSGFNTAEAVVIPALTNLGIDQLDALVLSHADRDHAGAAPALLENLAVAKLYLGEETPNLPRAGIGCHSGKSWRWEGVSFEFLAGPEPSQSGNNASCVLKVGAGAASVLLTGDIEGDIEGYLLASQKDLLPADVLIAPHHGSKTSSTTAFIAAVAPREVVFSAGRHNAYGHPASSVLRRYAQRGSRCWHSGQHGTIQFRFRSGELADIYYAREWQYYWETPANAEICRKFKSEG
ncbi:DNA internalization-related competence protein ComEC/Rec2 [Zhongshania sp.]|uniref:DNA internalization-related competence protein ComEC/Rec2 n=1 Tax=Zhongshania sp. TaxID=1971902 RepID=UPI0035673D10